MKESMNVDFIQHLSIALGTLLFFIDVMVMMWVALFRLEQIEDSLGNCQIIIESRRQRKNLGLHGRQYRLASAIGALLFTDMYARKGLVDMDQVRDMPKPLRRWALIPFVTGGLLFLLLVVLMFMDGKI